MGFDVSLGAAGLRSFAHAMIGMGLAFSPEPLFAGQAAYLVSFLMALLVQACQGELASVDWSRPDLLWFAAAGFMHGIALWVMNAALTTTPVSVVVPLISTTPLFTLGFSLILFRGEIITWRQVAMVFIVLLGVVLIVARA